MLQSRFKPSTSRIHVYTKYTKLIGNRKKNIVSIRTGKGAALKRTKTINNNYQQQELSITTRVYFVIDWVLEFLNTPSYMLFWEASTVRSVTVCARVITTRTWKWKWYDDTTEISSIIKLDNLAGYGDNMRHFLRVLKSPTTQNCRTF
jgi:phage-related protein